MDKKFFQKQSRVGTRRRSRHARHSFRRALLGNFAKLYGLGFFFGLHLVIPIFVPLLQGHGLTMSEILQTQAIFALTVAALELPSGYLADIWGRKYALVVGSVVSAAGFILLQSATTFGDFVLFEVLMGVAVSLCSGADLALLYDTQTALGHRVGRLSKSSSASAFARLLGVSSLAECIAGLLATVLLFWSIEWLLFFQIVISLVPILIALSLVESPKQSTAPVAIAAEPVSPVAGPPAAGLRPLLRQPVLVWTALCIVAFGLVGLFSFWLHQKYWSLAGIDMRYFGCIWALFCLTRAIAAHYAEKLERKLGVHRLLALVCALPLIALVGMLVLPPWLGIVVSLLFPLGRGIGYVVMIDALNTRIAGSYRATLNSLISLVSRAIFIVTGPLLGLAVDWWGVKTALLLLLLCAAPVLVTVTWQLTRSINALLPETAVARGD